MTPAAALQRFDPLDALRRVFPDVDLRNLEACFAASGQDIHATVQTYRAHQSRDALATRLAQTARADDGADECAGVLVEQIANYALSVRLRDADGCRFQAHRGPSLDVF